VDRFGRIDVLVNNAGNFFAGFFEEISPEDFRAQVETNLFGPLNVTWAVLPVMRAQRSRLVESTSYAMSTIDDYTERTERTVTAWNGMNGRQGGDAAGVDAVEVVEQKAKVLLDQAAAHRALSSSLAHDDTNA
jgi:NAD(P)-dependent dehydrogenase (short-subunit alcohol dehydrogenase family)